MSDKTFPYDVFLSHSSKDKPAVRELANRLKSDGLEVWLDEWVIKPGDSIPAKIERGLEESRTLILCMTANAFASDWASLERHTFLFRDPSNAERRFIPLLLQDCKIPDVLKQFAYVDWRAKPAAEYNRLLLACRPSAGQEQKQSTKSEKSLCTAVLQGHTDGIFGVALSADGRLALSGSDDNTVRLWDVETKECLKFLYGHTSGVNGVAFSNDGCRALSGSDDKTVRLWDLSGGKCLKVMQGHAERVWSVALSTDGRHALSGSDDKTIRLWDLSSGQCLKILKGHADRVMSLAVSTDGQRAISGSQDSTVRLWDLHGGQCLKSLEGHTSFVLGVALSADGCQALSGSFDKTIRLWDLRSGQCLKSLEGHNSGVWGVAIFSDGHRALSGSYDRTLRWWDLRSGQCLKVLRGHTGGVHSVALSENGLRAVSGSTDKTLRVWDLSSLAGIETSEAEESALYTNAKVVLVGESGVGKTGLALRICEDRWEATESTHGMMVSQLKLPQKDESKDIEREVWLWDFAGQPDYRLIHQLYMDETALGLLVFDPQDDNPFDALGHWDRALHVCNKHQAAKLLVAARSDRGGITISRQRFEQFIKERNYAGFLTTGAKTGEGCSELKAAIAEHIPWDRLMETSTTKQFKALKDAIIKLQEEKTPLIRLPELRQRLQFMLPAETIGEPELRAVVSLIQNQGVLHMLAFGDFVLLQTEWINRYASVVVRMARESLDEMGIVPEQQVLDGRLDYKDMPRLSESDEKILLRAIVQTFLDRNLCIREHTPKGTMLVFPSYFRRDRPVQPDHPQVFLTYGFSGPLETIYSTLVVRLSYSEEFKKDELWQNAADFKTHGGKRVGLLMTSKGEGVAEIIVYFDIGVEEDTKVTFVKYIHEHLLAKAEDVSRIRHYICPNPECGEPVESMKAVRKAVVTGKKSIVCQYCDKPIVLFDLIEEKFASTEALQRVRDLDARAGINLDRESLELILVGQAMSIAAEAGHIFRPTPNSDWGIDGEIEFKNDKGQASGKRVYLQLKSGDSHLRKRERDEKEVFPIKHPRHAEYWQSQAYPVLLVIRTSDGIIRWMNVTDYLKKHGKDTKQIIFDGEPFTAPNLAKLRDRLFKES